MNIDIQLLPHAPNKSSISNKTVVVIDVLRATSVIVQAFSQGIKEVIPVKTVNEVFAKLKDFPEGETILGGERKSIKINGFDLGNSPLEYTSERLKNKRLILCTTNGTRAFDLVSAGKEVIVCSFLNISAVVERCLNLGLDIFIFTAGDKTNFSLEDCICGGMLINLLIKKGKGEITLTDSSYASLFLFQRFEDNLIGALHLSRHGKELIDLGGAEDIIYCSQIDVIPIVPVFRDGIIKL